MPSLHGSWQWLPPAQSDEQLAPQKGAVPIAVPRPCPPLWQKSSQSTSGDMVLVFCVGFSGSFDEEQQQILWPLAQPAPSLHGSWQWLPPAQSDEQLAPQKGAWPIAVPRPCPPLWQSHHNQPLATWSWCFASA